MLFIAWIVFVGVWGVIIFNAYRTIKSRIEQKREMKKMLGYWGKQAELQRNYNKAMYNVINSAGKGD
jgi:hypothetical protein